MCVTAAVYGSKKHTKKSVSFQQAFKYLSELTIIADLHCCRLLVKSRKAVEAVAVEAFRTHTLHSKTCFILLHANFTMEEPSTLTVDTQGSRDCKTVAGCKLYPNGPA